MPVTLRKNVNGQAVAIKLSILDVLFGVPPPKAKASKPALASRSPQKSDNLVTAWLSENTAVDNTGKDVSTKDKEKVASKQGTDENGPNFTDAENAKLIEMKAAGKTWREIASEMNKSQSSLKEHFKKIRTPSEAEGQPSENAKPGGREAPSTKVSKEQHGTGNIVNRNPTVEGDETNVKKLQKKEAKSKTEVINNGSKAKPQASPQATSVASIAAKYDRDKWRFAASKYYDLTGVRISVEEAKCRAQARAGD